MSSVRSRRLTSKCASAAIADTFKRRFGVVCPWARVPTASEPAPVIVIEKPRGLCGHAKGPQQRNAGDGVFARCAALLFFACGISACTGNTCGVDFWESVQHGPRMPDDNLLEVQCPSCRSLRALFPEEVDPIKCYSCGAFLDRTGAHPLRRPSPERTDARASNRSVILVLSLVVVGAAGIGFFRFRATKAAAEELENRAAYRAVYSQLIDGAERRILPRANSLEPSLPFGVIRYPWVDRCYTGNPAVPAFPGGTLPLIPCSDEVHISKAESAQLDPYVRSGAFRGLRSLVAKILRLDSVNELYLGVTFPNYSLDIWVVDLKSGDITAHRTISNTPLTGYIVNYPKNDPVHWRLDEVITRGQLWLDSLPWSP